jgi:heme/copper-type cytochrome/quinol oxidase subunit 4
VAVVPSLLRRRFAKPMVTAVVAAMALLLPFLPTGIAVHNGGTGLEDSDVAGCHCHNVAPDPDVTLNLMGLQERYVPDQTYVLTITVAGGPPVLEGAQNEGGFMLSCTNGTFSVPEGSDLVQVFGDGQSVSHTMAGNDFRQWTVVWKAPKEGTGDAIFHLSANTVNGDGVETGELDAYNQLLSVSLGEPEDPGPVDDVSEWGVPLRAYWMGSIAFVATLALTWAAFYLIRGTSRHHQVHVGSRRRYLVEERSPPSSFGAAMVIGVLAVVEVIASALLFQGLSEGAKEEAIAIYLAIILALFLVIIAIYRSTFVPRLTSIEPEDSGIEGGDSA